MQAFIQCRIITNQKLKEREMEETIFYSYLFDLQYTSTSTH